MRYFTLLLMLTLLSNTALGQRGRTIKWVNPQLPEVKGLTHKVLASKSLGHDVGYAVWTPPAYNANDARRYPVVYFLHGAGGSEASDAGGFSSRVAAAVRKKKFRRQFAFFPTEE